MATYYDKDTIELVKQIPALEYLLEYEPGAVFMRSNTYFLKEHDSLYFSNGMWRWSSQSIGGNNALQFLQKVYDMSFTDAMERLCSCYGITPKEKSNYSEKAKKFREAKEAVVIPEEKTLVLPPKAADNKRVFAYLRSRGISANVLRHFIKEKMIYQDQKYGNCVFVGYDDFGVPKYAGLRTSNSNFTFRGDASGSDKSFSFRHLSENSETVHLFEAPIDLLSYATYMELEGYDFRNTNLVSVAGIVKPKEDGTTSMPVAISKFLENRRIHTICIHYDNDEKGLAAGKALESLLSAEGYRVRNLPVPAEFGKDVNDYLLNYLERKKNLKPESIRKQINDITISAEQLEPVVAEHVMKM